MLEQKTVFHLYTETLKNSVSLSLSLSVSLSLSLSVCVCLGVARGWAGFWVAWRVGVVCGWVDGRCVCVCVCVCVCCLYFHGLCFNEHVNA